jgi:hypothetical protein
VRCIRSLWDRKDVAGAARGPHRGHFSPLTGVNVIREAWRSTPPAHLASPGALLAALGDVPGSRTEIMRQRTWAWFPPAGIPASSATRSDKGGLQPDALIADAVATAGGPPPRPARCVLPTADQAEEPRRGDHGGGAGAGNGRLPDAEEQRAVSLRPPGVDAGGVRRAAPASPDPCGEAARAPSKDWAKAKPGLAEVCRVAGLPAATCSEGLPAGEQRAHERLAQHLPDHSEQWFGFVGGDKRSRTCGDCSWPRRGWVRWVALDSSSLGNYSAGSLTTINRAGALRRVRDRAWSTRGAPDGPRLRWCRQGGHGN